MLREYVEATRALWAREQAECRGGFVRFEPSWAWPKPVRGAVPVLIGASGTERTFEWFARSGDGWIITPQDDDVAAKADRLRAVWAAAGRDGTPRVVALDRRPGADRLAEWAYLDWLVGRLDAMQPGSLAA